MNRPRSLAWLDDAACRGTDLAVWFPDTRGGRDGARKAAVEYAARWCNACPVRRECEDYSRNETHGIWASTDREKAR